MSLPLKKTLTTLRAELQARLGFANQGAPSLLQRTVLNSFLQEAQEDLFWEYGFGERRTTTDISTAIGQTLYDWPSNVDPLRRIEVRVHVSGRWIPLTVGIEAHHDSITADTRTQPLLYDTGPQLEIWPEPDAVYTLRIEHFPRLGAFTNDSDRASMPDALVLKLALAKGKLHYRQPDAQEALQSAGRQITAMKAAEQIDRRHIRRPRRRRPLPPQDPYGVVPPKRI